MNRQRIRIAGALLLLVVTPFFVYWRARKSPNYIHASALVQEIHSDVGRVKAPELSEKTKDLRNRVRNLSSMQRLKLRKEIFNLVKKDVAGYSRMSPAEKQQHLDNVIDFLEQVRQLRDARNAQAARTGKAGADKDDGSDDSGRLGFLRDPRNLLDRTTPEERLQFDNFRKDLQARRAQLGMPNPSFQPLSAGARGRR